MISLDSVNGPSITDTFPPESTTRAPVSVPLSPPLPRMVPALTASWLIWSTAAISSFGGKPCSTLCFTIIMNCIGPSPLFSSVNGHPQKDDPGTLYENVEQQTAKSTGSPNFLLPVRPWRNVVAVP